MPSAADTRSITIDTLPATHGPSTGPVGSPVVGSGADDAQGSGSEPLRPGRPTFPTKRRSDRSPDRSPERGSVPGPDRPSARPTVPAYRYYAAASLDGFLADEDDDLDWLESQPLDAHGPMNSDEFMSRVGALVMGVTTYRWIIAHTDTWPYTQPTFVFTHQPLEPFEDSITVLSGPLEAHRERFEEAADGKDVWIVGGGDLASQFADAGMLDEVTLHLAPVMLGSGRPLFTGRTDLELREVAHNDGFVCVRYGVSGEAS